MEINLPDTKDECDRICRIAIGSAVCFLNGGIKDNSKLSRNYRNFLRKSGNTHLIPQGTIYKDSKEGKQFDRNALTAENQRLKTKIENIEKRLNYASNASRERFSEIERLKKAIEKALTPEQKAKLKYYEERL